jgi:SAM-dependent methyltransferase
VSAQFAGSLLQLLRCPACRSTLVLSDSGLSCIGGGHAFPVVNGVPVLIDEEVLASNPQYAHQRGYFDAEFAGYGDYRLENWRVSYLERLTAADALGGTGAPLIDVGVGGSGYTVIEAARAGRHAVGCDLSVEALMAASRFAREEGVFDRTLFVCCSAELLPFASASFDVALAIAVIEHVPDDAAALAEMARVLRAGGRAWITVPHALRHMSPVFRLPNVLHDRRLGHLRRYDASDLREACDGVGLLATDTQFTGHPIKVLQLAAGTRPSQRWLNAAWWWCERRDLARAKRRRGSMQLSLALRRSSSEPDIDDDASGGE